MTQGLFYGEKSETFGEGFGIKWYISVIPTISPVNVLITTGPCIVFNLFNGGGGSVKVYDALTATGVPIWLQGNQDLNLGPYGFKFAIGIYIAIGTSAGTGDAHVGYIPLAEQP